MESNDGIKSNVGIESTENINSETAVLDPKIQDGIIRTIKRIKSSRSRPCSQNSFTYLERHFKFNLNMEELKEILKKLMEDNIIQNNGSRKGVEKEASFCIVNNGEVILVDKSNLQENTNANSIENLMNFVDDRFFDTLSDFIKKRGTMRY